MKLYSIYQYFSASQQQVGRMLIRLISTLLPICIALLSTSSIAGFKELPDDDIAASPCHGSEVMDCALSVANEMAQPLDGYKLVRHAVHTVNIGREYKKVATVLDVVWRNEEVGGCIYGTKIVAFVGRAGQTLNINNVSRAGFKGLPVATAYASHAGSRISVFAIGRSQDNDTVVFETEVNPPKRLISPMLFVKTACSSKPPETSPNAIRLRQTEEPFIELSLPGFVPKPSITGTTVELPFQK